MGIDRRRIANVWIVDGRLWTPASTVHRLGELLNRRITRLTVRLERLGPYEETPLPETVFTDFADLHLPPGALIVGIGSVGLWAARYQELERPDLHVIAVCCPSSAEEVKLEFRSERRVALYCSEGKSLAGKVADWPNLAEAYDATFLRSGCDRHPYSLADLIVAYLHDGDLAWEIEYIFDRPPLDMPTDRQYQEFVSDCLRRGR